ncbi:ATP-dependent helicase [Litchfieldia alkalitelluris]|uniref:ATP-dependent helicase n=1 Tax=Litchfieldia alkalitelluris TaxID=304268 RepID=UPI000997BC7B|nr:ATP-dependent helicase [Litchfieldia alkalitelluris]
MQKALLDGKMLDLNIYPREQFQYLYEAGIHNKLTCGCCGEKLKLYLGIHKQPYFYHLLTSDSSTCNNYMEDDVEQPERVINTKMEDQTIELNGFTLPKSRSIQSVIEKDPKIGWKSPKELGPLSPFSENTVPTEEQYSMSISLDFNQFDAVTTPSGPLLILAGAGSGKTRVLTSRTAFLLREQGVDPKTIMLVTFTAKAAKEMKDRLSKFTGISQQQIQSLITGTFHSIFYKIVSFHQPTKWNSHNLLKWDYQKEQIIKEAARELELDEKQFAFDQALQLIGLWKNTLLIPNIVKPKDQWEERVQYMYKHYEKRKNERGLFDFDDMLVGCYQLFLDDPELLKKYQDRFSHFLIDEYQDINKVQYETIKLLTGSSKNLCVVGDDDQAIYAFRGSDPTFMLKFEQDFPDVKVVTLSQNYRSSHGIVDSANKVIANNKERRIKKMLASFTNGQAPFCFFPYDEEEEATVVVTDIKEKIQQGASPSDFAILFRTHTASRAIFERLTQSNLPFHIEQDSESFYQRRMVRGALAYLQLSIDSNDTQAMTHVITTLFLKQKIMNDLKAISILEDCTLTDALGSIKDIHPFQQKKLKKIVPLFSLLKTMNPLSAIEMIEKEMGFGDFIKKSGNEGNSIEKGSDDLRDLKVVARKFKHVHELLEHVNHMTAMNKEMKQLSKQFREAIQLSTIHRSKGLEYKHVYLLGAVEGCLPHDFALDSLRNGDKAPIEEERRLLYVAMTRAEQSLSISVPNMRRNKTAKPSRFIKDLIKKY